MSITVTSMVDSVLKRLSDPNAAMFDRAYVLSELNYAVTEVCTLLNPLYLSELEYEQTSVGVQSENDMYIRFSDLTYSPLLGKLGALKIVVRDEENVQHYSRLMTVDQIPKVSKNSFYKTVSNDLDNLHHYIQNQKIYLKDFGDDMKKINVLYIKEPDILVEGANFPMNRALAPIVMLLAESSIWRSDGKNDRSDSIYNRAVAMINTMNQRVAETDNVGYRAKKE